MKNALNTLLLLFRSWRLTLIKPKPVKKPALFIDILRQYVSKQFTENSFSDSTRKKYDHILLNMEMYFKLKRLMSLRAEDLRIAHMENLKLWLHSNLKSCCLSHSARHQEVSKRALKYAVQMGWLEFNPLESMDTKRDKIKEVIHLEEEELEKLILTKFSADIYTVAADLYVFQASTGLSYSDLYTYDFVTEKTGKQWIYNTRAKSGVPYYVPVFYTAKRIHDKYAGKLPYLTNAAYNRVLKEVALQLGFEKTLTTHTARKTFSTLMDNHRVSTEAISRMLGHSSVVVTERHYLRANRTRLDKEMVEVGLIPA